MYSISSEETPFPWENNENLSCFICKDIRIDCAIQIGISYPLERVSSRKRNQAICLVSADRAQAAKDSHSSYCSTANRPAPISPSYQPFCYHGYHKQPENCHGNSHLFLVVLAAPQGSSAGKAPSVRFGGWFSSSSSSSSSKYGVC